MSKKHIVTLGGNHFAFDSVNAATQLVALLAKSTPVEHVTNGGYDNWHYTPKTAYLSLYSPKLELNQPFRDLPKPKPEKPKKALVLPAPKRGTIRCICDHSDVAPRQSCTHCGRPFSESHNRVHQDKSTAHGIALRLL